MHARQNLDGRSRKREIRSLDIVRGYPGLGRAELGIRDKDSFPESGDDERGEHVAGAAEVAVQGWDVDAEETWGAV